MKKPSFSHRPFLPAFAALLRTPYLGAERRDEIMGRVERSFGECPEMMVIPEQSAGMRYKLGMPEQGAGTRKITEQSTGIRGIIYC